MLDSKINKKRIRQVFKQFDFNRVKEYPLPIIIIILKEVTVTDAFKQYLLSRKNITTKDVDLMLTYLCQIDFADNDILKKLDQYQPMNQVVSKITSPNLSYNYPGYYNLCDIQVDKLSTMPTVIEQIRHRVFHERIGSHSVALNHLLNELHAICYQLDSTNNNHKEYDVNRVVQFLHYQGVSHEICIGIRKLFDRRNTNQVSHPGSDDFIAWSVSKPEYDQYYGKVSECLGLLVKPN